MAARRMSRRGGGLRQVTDWGRIAATVQTTVAAGTKALLISTQPTESDETVRRTILQVHIGTDTPGATEFQSGAVGCFIANEAAVTAGAASLLGPVTDQNSDAWLLWAAFVQGTIGGVAVNYQPRSGRVYTFDSKGQRKLQEGQRHVVMVENANATHGFVIQVSMSVLFGFSLRR